MLRMSSTIPLALATPPRRFRPVRWLGGAVLVLMLIAAVALTWLFTIARSVLPDLDGAVPVAGISAPVTVNRDKHGVPTLEAATLSDLFFAQGYITAQDRLFQMDLLRRAAAGELSEIVGDVALKHDRQQRILGIRATAEKGLLAATPEDREQFAAYARGVNAYLRTHRNHLPLEFRVLGYSPRPWTEKDFLMIAYQMVETLSTNPLFALTRERVLAKLGPELTADLYVNTSWRDHPPTATTPALDAPPPDEPVTPARSIASSARPGPAKLSARPRAGTIPARAASRTRIQRLGGVGSTPRHRQAAAFERHAPRPSDAEPLVRGTPALRRFRRGRSHAPPL